jgi:antitoxin component YwqK of YwqJK toxin-antitoxin module
MKKLLLIVLPLLLIVGCSKEPINYDEILKYEKVTNTKFTNRGDGVYYTKDTNKPYSGPVFSLHKNGDKASEGNLKDGKKDGLWISRTETNILVGRGNSIHWERTYKDGIRHGLSTRYSDGQKRSEIKYKNGFDVKIIIKDGKKILY